jgi:GntR family transcriptional regulator
MEFRDNKAIYLQIADFVYEQILLKQWTIGEKIPSVRELAVQLEVNPNTVARTFEYLQMKEVIFTKRGMGNFVNENAESIVKSIKKEDFLQNDLPVFFKNMQLLGIDIEELKGRFIELENK